MRVLMALLRRLALFLAALTGLSLPAAATTPAAAPAPASDAQPEPSPAIWLIEDDDTKIYLFGTVHAFPASTRWRSAALNRIIDEVDELVMETPDVGPDLGDPERMMRPMQLGKSVPILSRVSPEARPALAAAILATGIPIEAFDEMTTWGAGFLLSGFQINQAYAENGVPVAMSGAEEVLGRIFRKSRRPISGVETVEDQLRVFSTLPLSAQQLFLESTVGYAPAMTQAQASAAEALRADTPVSSPASERLGTDEAWLRGNVEAIGEEMLQMPPAIYDPLLTRRNRNWTEWLIRRLERPGSVLFAVGAGHLAGPHSVQTMLAQQGIRARRIH